MIAAPDTQLTDTLRGVELFERYMEKSYHSWSTQQHSAQKTSSYHRETLWQCGSSSVRMLAKIPPPTKEKSRHGHFDRTIPALEIPKPPIKEGAPVVLVSSLLNSEDIFSLPSPRIPHHRGFDQQLQTRTDVYILRWGCPNKAERGFGLFDYAWRLGALLLWIKQRHQQPAHVLGYCLGGTIATLCLKLSPNLAQSLTLLASPWDFHQTPRAPLIGKMLWQQLTQHPHHTVNRSIVAQSLQMLNPWRTLQRYKTIAQCQDNPQQLDRTLRLHQWACGCVDITTQLAKDIAQCYWYNALLHYCSKGVLSSPLKVSTLFVVPQMDELVPPLSSMALVSMVASPQILSLATGHLGAIINPGLNKQFIDGVLIFWQTIENTIPRTQYREHNNT